MRRILYILLALNLIFIWGNSALSGQQSHSISDLLIFGVESAMGDDGSDTSSSTSSKPSGETVGNTNPVIRDTLDSNENTPVIRKVIRKTAHILEYLTLGVICLLLCRYDESWLEKAKRLLLVAAFVPLVDETIQVFSKRTSSIGDIWMDIGGFIAGCLLVAVIQAVKRRKARQEATAQEA